MSTVIEKNPNSNIVYYINEEKKTVVCKLNTCIADMYNYLYKFPIVSYNFIDDLVEKNIIKSCYTAKAVCVEEDNWDVEKGKRIALAKVLKRYHKDKFFILSTIINRFYNSACEIEKSANKSFNRVISYCKELHELKHE